MINQADDENEITWTAKNAKPLIFQSIVEEESDVRDITIMRKQYRGKKFYACRWCLRRFSGGRLDKAKEHMTRTRRPCSKKDGPAEEGPRQVRYINKR